MRFASSIQAPATVIETFPRQGAADKLLKFLQVRGNGTGAVLRNAVEYCFGVGPHYLEVGRRFCALGEIEVDWDGDAFSWRATPAAFFSFRDESGLRLYELSGALSICDETDLRRTGCEIEMREIEFVEGFAITRKRIAAPDRERIPAMISAIGLPLAMDLGYDLWNRLPPVANVLVSAPFTRVDNDLDYFDPGSRRFVENAGFKDAEGLFRYRDYARPYYYVRLRQDAPSQYRPVELSIGLWSVLRNDQELRIIHRADQLLVPKFPPLPVLYERWLYVCGAVRQIRLFRGGEWLAFTPVDVSLARQICQKLGRALERQ
jgi:hypothetical protein